MNPGQGLGIEIIATLQLVLCVLATTDRRRRDLGGSAPLAIGLSVALGHLLAVSEGPSWVGAVERVGADRGRVLRLGSFHGGQELFGPGAVGAGSGVQVLPMAGKHSDLLAAFLGPRAPLSVVLTATSVPSLCLTLSSSPSSLLLRPLPGAPPPHRLTTPAAVLTLPGPSALR